MHYANYKYYMRLLGMFFTIKSDKKEVHRLATYKPNTMRI